MMRSAIGGVMAAVTLTACGTVSRPPIDDAQPGGFQAMGEDPNWQLSVGAERIVYLDESNRVRVEERNPSGRLPGIGRFVAGRVTVDVAGEPCALPTRGSYAQRVQVTVDGKSFNGCGGGRTTDLGLTSGGWSVVAVNGRSTPNDRPYVASFTGGIATFRLGCATLTAPYRLSGALLTPGRVSRSEAGCAGGAAPVDAGPALSAPLSVEAAGAEQITLRNALGSIALIRAAR